jgi:hypothetical protein
VIYFVRPEGRPLVKIGHARNVGLRVYKLQVACPDELVILGVVAGGFAKEAALHARFAHLHVRGEWFRYTREVFDYLKAHAEQYQPHAHDPAAEDAARREKWAASLGAEPPASPEWRRRIRVWLQRFADRPYLMLQWIDPGTGKRRSKTTGTANRDEAELRRADLEAVLNHPSARNGSRNTGPEVSKREHPTESQPEASEQV